MFYKVKLLFWSNESAGRWKGSSHGKVINIPDTSDIGIFRWAEIRVAAYPNIVFILNVYS